MTAEQEQHHADLVKKYGQMIVRQARHLSGLTICLQALALDDLEGDERKESYARAGAHLAELLETMMSAEYSAKVTECASRIDSALELWMADELERKQGLH